MRWFGRRERVTRAAAPPPSAEPAQPEPEHQIPSLEGRLNRERWDVNGPAGAAAPELPPVPADFQCNKLCAIEDWQIPAMRETMRRIIPYYLDVSSDYPNGLEHRKHWEFAQLLLSLERHGAVRPEATVLGVGSGHEEPVYDLSWRCARVVCTDIYGTGTFTVEGDARMLVEPDYFARCRYNRRHLTVEFMDALDLRFDDECFDGAFSAGSIEHFGGVEGAVSGISEMARVVKEGGVVAVTTECIVNDQPDFFQPGLALFRPETIAEMVARVPRLVPVEPLDLHHLTAMTASLPVETLAHAVEDSARGKVTYPHVLVEHEGRLYTSASIVLRRV